MKKTKKIIFAGLFTALYLLPLEGFSAPTEEDRASNSSTTGVHGDLPTPAIQDIETVTTKPTSLGLMELKTKPDDTKGCKGCLLRFGRGLKVTKKFLNENVLPYLELALLFVDDAETATKIQTAIDLTKAGSKLIQFNEDGSIKFEGGKLRGQTLANAVVLLLGDKSGLLTDESHMFAALVLSKLPKSDYESMIKLIGFLALGDNPATDHILTFDAKTGSVGLNRGRVMQPEQTFSLISEEMGATARDQISPLFEEYIMASKARTAVETKVDGEKRRRAEGNFLPSEGRIIPAYADLIKKDSTYRLVDLAVEVVTGKKSVTKTTKELAALINGSTDAASEA